MPGPLKQHGLAPGFVDDGDQRHHDAHRGVTTATVMTRELASLKPTECHKLVE